MKKPKLIVAVGSAGDDALAGPLVAAAVVYSADRLPPELRYAVEKKAYSKTFSDYSSLPDFVQELAIDHLRKTAHGWATTNQPVRLKAAVARKRLDVMGLAVGRAVEKMIHLRPESLAGIAKEDIHVHIPGASPVPYEYVASLTQIIFKDNRDWRLDAAAALAQHTHKELMVRLADQHPVYGFDTHFGYNTPGHRAVIKQHGPTTEHRK